ncbi:MAG: glycosyltransferase family 4 protein [Neomegalonema sp.]|nr:glycosyltransferase family 4 protein [Neomegalonema sp.]
MTAPAIAFYAPMKPPDHPTPSGDRTMARSILKALEGIGPPAFLASRLRSRDGAGDARVQQEIIAAAEAEAARLKQGPPIALWITYHNYYKAPDLLGPVVAAAYGAPYLVVEPSISAKRAHGAWAAFNRAADAATAQADALFYMTERDAPALRAALRVDQRLVHLRPFLPREHVEPSVARAFEPPLRLLAVGMMRPGDKLESYRALAQALAFVRTPWRLEVVGDGPARAETEALFAEFAPRIVFRGRLEPEALEARYEDADLFVWPGVNEAYGLVYLEAQAAGTPVVAENRPGVRDVVRAGGQLTPPQSPRAFAAAIDQFAERPDLLARTGAAAAEAVASDHLLHAARRALATTFAPLLERTL